MKTEDILTGGAPPAEEATFNFDLREYLRIVTSRWPLILAITLASLVLALVRFYLTPPAYRATALLQIEQRSPVALSGERNPYVEAYLRQTYFPTQFRLLRSRNLAERTVRSLEFQVDDGADTPAEDEAEIAAKARRILSAITVDPVSGTELVSIHHISSDPKHSADVVNTLAQEFISWNIENRAGIVDRTSNFLNLELDRLRQEITDKEAQLAEYQRRSDIVSADPGSNLTLRRLEQLNSDLLSARSETRARLSALRELSSRSQEAVADAESNGLVGDMRRNQVRLEADYDSKLQTYKPDWPDMVELKASIDDAEREILAAIDRYVGEARTRLRGEYQAALGKERGIEREIDTVKSQALDFNSASVEYNSLRLEIDTRRERQDELLRQLETAAMSARMFDDRQSNVRVIESALVPTRPFRPSFRNSVVSGLALGLALGIGLALLLHLLDRTVKTPEELERLLKLPLLGVIPDVSEGSRGSAYYGYYGYGRKRGSRSRDKTSEAIEQVELLPAIRPRLAICEAYRSLRTALLLSSAEKLRLISITSAESGEGKTTTATNLAVVLAQLGKQVLLIDADLRKPRLHKVFGESNQAGLVNSLTGTVQPEELIRSTSVPNLFLSPAGPHPPNPSELLASERMRAFLEFAQQKFDMVVIDTPPVLAVTDAVIVARFCDGVVLCFRAEKVLREDVKSCRNRLQMADTRILGAILNRHQPAKGGGYGRRYRHYYEAYGEGEDDARDSSAA